MFEYISFVSKFSHCAKISLETISLKQFKLKYGCVHKRCVRCALLYVVLRVKESYAQMNIFSPQIISFTQSCTRRSIHTHTHTSGRERDAKRDPTAENKSPLFLVMHYIVIVLFILFLKCKRESLWCLFVLFYIFCFSSHLSFLRTIIFQWLILAKVFFFVRRFFSLLLPIAIPHFSISIFFGLSVLSLSSFFSIDFCLNVFLMW